ncbi:PH domain-containing protein [Natronosporangium hydrolyticum]|uniref:PH domain-containing protein n=1 Tax=Natronosporangium hydrolyticum TaxID=2811111 RepID=A0A895YU36_9ACTN|nr:PH domain-containing protein [Natronosporangium hydrolyticum]
MPRKVPIGKLVVAALLAAVAAPGVLASGQWWQYALAIAAVVGLIGWAARDLIAPVRLTADPDGLTMLSGFARQHRVTWSEVERIRVDARRHSRMLEVDTGEQLYLFSRYDLDADLDEVVAELTSIRAEARP